ncbi:helix-turn-helix domain-containing GNAT family N-acetyltransferase [Mycobacterium sp. ITM-2016-00318]|uniref:bifunctional helix-turn-helix transcriptional regulator/GNAT family N-acetyltransferase n=1 Tax=Mycobacterium sp. ITM-2016-00318 TaxID=2099693 RepID=UPI0018EE3CB4|nr:helix-turn-helix domain-containing GNAT family N-acetyltransferase [Mycobacterium sp. ITM-2016-00318]WNG90806.1 helix-turn-helix domain-containing GNAT family N-acetyltransferase [Mycobacterium sp. ITM-2016-00318]
MPRAVVTQIREFNRFYTRIIGLLRPKLAGSAFGLTEARVLFELAHSDQQAVTDLRRDLDLDAGYLSRILSRFIADGLVQREPSATDGRRHVVRLTPAGHAAFVEADSLQAEAIDRLVARLDEDQRCQLGSAMGRIRRVLDDDRDGVGGLVLRPPAPGDLGWVVARHGARYAAEHGWGAGFEGLVARVVADFVDRGDNAREGAWIAELGGDRVGSIFCTAADDANTAQLRLLLVEPQARGAGVGTRLVDQCLDFARRSGYTRIMLWTTDLQTQACRIYQRAGFSLDRSEPETKFGHDIVGEYWSRDL